MAVLLANRASPNTVRLPEEPMCIPPPGPAAVLPTTVSLPPTVTGPETTKGAIRLPLTEALLPDASRSFSKSMRTPAPTFTAPLSPLFWAMRTLSFHVTRQLLVQRVASAATDPFTPVTVLFTMSAGPWSVTSKLAPPRFMAAPIPTAALLLRRLNDPRTTTLHDTTVHIPAALSLPGTLYARALSSTVNPESNVC
jgi:hypothetical protein